jgi:hypothetical protein
MANVTIYDQPNFVGPPEELSLGRYDTANNEISIGNDALSSLQVPQGLVARLFEHYHFQGRFIDIRADTPALDAYWDNRTSSIVVYNATDPPPDTKEVMIFEDANYAGAFQILEIGQTDQGNLSIGDNKLSSALVPYGMVLRLFENPGFSGAFTELREDTPAVSMDWNDRASSVVVEEAPVGTWQFSDTNVAIMGESTVFNGVRGLGHANDQPAIVGLNDNYGPGIRGQSAGTGVWGESSTWVGVYGHSVGTTGGAGVWGENPNGTGVYGKGITAGQFDGDVVVTGDIRLTGDVVVTGDIRLINADCAEDFDISAAEPVAPGMVMVLGADDALKPCQHAYDKRVVGVVSGAGDYRPGIVLDKHPDRANRSSVALLGKVFCRVDADYGPVTAGDLLTTSDTPGHAMKAADPFRAFGSVIGKALRSLEVGQGLIPILIALQ